MYEWPWGGGYRQILGRAEVRGRAVSLLPLKAGESSFCILGIGQKVLLHQPALLGGRKSSLFSGSRPHRNSRDQLWLTDLPNYKATWSLQGERVGGGCGRAGMHHLQSLPLMASAAEAKEH